MDPFITRASVCGAGNKSRHWQGSFHMLTLTILQHSHKAFWSRLGLALCASGFQQLPARPDLTSSLVLGHLSLIFAPLHPLGKDNLLLGHKWFSANPYGGAWLTLAARNIDQHVQPRQGEVSLCQDSSAFTEHVLMSILRLAPILHWRGHVRIAACHCCLLVRHLLSSTSLRSWFGSPGANFIIITFN